MAPHSSTLAWKIPWTEEPRRLQSMGSLRSDTTERLPFHFSLSCIGEGNGNPLECSCLENPRDGGAWWAAIYGVAQSRTRLKQLSSSSNLPWFMDLTFQVPMQYCSLQHWTLLPLPVTSTTGRCFCLAPSFILSPLFSSSILGTYQPGEFMFQCLIFLPFHTVHGVLKARILKWFAIPFSMDHILSELSTMTRPSWVALHGMVHSFIEFHSQGCGPCNQLG